MPWTLLRPVSHDNSMKYMAIESPFYRQEMDTRTIDLLAPGHTARMCQRTDLNPSSMALETWLLTTLRLALLKDGRPKLYSFLCPVL